MADAAKPDGYARTVTREDSENPHPILCVWELTLACDLGCKHCGSRAGRARPDELTTEQCLDVVRQLQEIGVREVTLIGGEAYLREDWVEIATAITDAGMLCGITTGARNLSQERIDMAEDAGVAGISVSIDGLERTHDAQRGPKGSWRAAVEASERIARSKIRLQTNSQINRLTLPELPAMADLLVELGSEAWQLQLTVAMGRAADRPELLLQPYDLLELFPLLVWMKQTKLDPGGVLIAPSNNVGYFGPYERHLRWGAERGAHWAGCTAGKYTIGLEADGKIKGCPSLPSAPYTGGNTKSDRLGDVVRDSWELRHLWHRTSDDLWGFCKTCYYADSCKAGCTWTAHTLLGRPGNNPYCIHRATELEKQGVRERVVKREAAPGDPFDFGRFDIVEEPIHTSDGAPSIVGLALGDVTSLRTDEPGIWSAADLKAVLRRQ